MLYTNWLACKCRTALPIFQQFLALSRFYRGSAFDSCDARRALRLAYMEASLTPTCAGHTQAQSAGALLPLLLHSSTAPEDRPHQFHPLHLCQQMMNPRSHVVHGTCVKMYTLLTTGPSRKIFTKAKTGTTLEFSVPLNLTTRSLVESSSCSRKVSLKCCLPWCKGSQLFHGIKIICINHGGFPEVGTETSKHFRRSKEWKPKRIPKHVAHHLPFGNQTCQSEIPGLMHVSEHHL